MFTRKEVREDNKIIENVVSKYKRRNSNSIRDLPYQFSEGSYKPSD